MSRIGKNLSRRAKQPEYAQSVVEGLRSRLGLPETVTPDALSKSFATHPLAGGAELRDIQELLGRGSAGAVEMRAEVNDNRLLEVYAKRAGWR